MSEPEEDEGKVISTVVAALKTLQPEARVQVVEFVMKRLGIELSSAPPVQNRPREPHQPPEAPFRAARAPELEVTDIRTFAEGKLPKTANEQVALVAYYLGNLAPEDERRDSVNLEDIKRYFKQAGFPLPTSSMPLTHAKNAGYLDALDRGQYRLNSVGHNLVAHKLPKSNSAPAPRRATKKAKPKKSASKAQSKR